MRGDRFGDSHLVVLCDGEDAVDVPARVDGDALARPGVPDEVDEVLHLRRGSEDLLFDWVLGVHRDVASGQQLSEVESIARLLRELHPVLERRVVRGALHRLLVVLERGGVVPLLERGLAVAEVALLPAGAETHGDVGVGRGHGVVLQFEVAEGEVAMDGAARGVVGCADHGIAVAALEGRREGRCHFISSDLGRRRGAWGFPSAGRDAGSDVRTCRWRPSGRPSRARRQPWLSHPRTLSFAVRDPSRVRGCASYGTPRGNN